MASSWAPTLLVAVALCIGIVRCARMTATDISLCEGLSPAEKWICEHPEHCGPRFSRSTCRDEDYKGLVLFYHGFSACPLQAVDITPLLQDACLDVFVPTVPGHGGAVQNCSAGGRCDTSFWEGSMGFDQRDLPTHSSKYKDFVAKVNVLVYDELEFRATEVGKPIQDLELSVMGLSFGGALASYGVSRNPGLFTRQLLLNPYYGLGQEGVDQAGWGCMKDVEKDTKNLSECLDITVQRWFESEDLTISENKPLRWLLANFGGDGGAIAGLQKTLFEYLSTLSDYPPGNGSQSLQGGLAKFMEKETVWGGNCPKIVEHNRGGFCAFRMKHMLATHAFGMEALVLGMKYQSNTDMPATQVITTQRDGFTRNGLAYALASKMYRNSKQSWQWLFQTPVNTTSIGYCMYRYKKGTDLRDNGAYWSTETVMPHANLLSGDNPGPVESRWWEPKLFSKVVNILSGQVDNVGEPMADADKNTCVDLPLEKGSIKKYPWLRELVLPEAAPFKQSSLRPGLFWNSVVLNFDGWARSLGCPNFKESLAGVVDCELLAQPKVEAPRCCCQNASSKSCKLMTDELVGSRNPTKFGAKVCPGGHGWHNVDNYRNIEFLPPACLVPHLRPRGPELVAVSEHEPDEDDW